MPSVKHETAVATIDVQKTVRRAIIQRLQVRQLNRLALRGLQLCARVPAAAQTRDGPFAWKALNYLQLCCLRAVISLAAALNSVKLKRSVSPSGKQPSPR